MELNLNLEKRRDHLDDLLKAYYGESEEVEKSEENDINNMNKKEIIDILADIDFRDRSLDINSVFSGIIKTRNLKDLLYIANELSENIRKYDTDMQLLLYTNYTKFMDSTNILKSLDGDLSSIPDCVYKLNSQVQQVKQPMEILTKELFNNYEMQKLNKISIIRKCIDVLDSLKFMEQLLESYYLNEEYNKILSLFRKWKDVLLNLSKDSKIYLKILETCNDFFERAIVALKTRLIGKCFTGNKSIQNENNTENNIECEKYLEDPSNEEILDCCRKAIDAYISLGDEKYIFTDDLYKNIIYQFDCISSNIILEIQRKICNINDINEDFEDSSEDIEKVNNQTKNIINEIESINMDKIKVIEDCQVINNNYRSNYSLDGNDISNNIDRPNLFIIGCENFRKGIMEPLISIIEILLNKGLLDLASVILKYCLQEIMTNSIQALCNVILIRNRNDLKIAISSVIYGFNYLKESIENIIRTINDIHISNISECIEETQNRTNKQEELNFNDTSKYLNRQKLTKQITKTYIDWCKYVINEVISTSSHLYFTNNIWEDLLNISTTEDLKDIKNIYIKINKEICDESITLRLSMIITEYETFGILDTDTTENSILRIIKRTYQDIIDSCIGIILKSYITSINDTSRAIPNLNVLKEKILIELVHDNNLKYNNSKSVTNNCEHSPPWNVNINNLIFERQLVYFLSILYLFCCIRKNSLSKVVNLYNQTMKIFINNANKHEYSDFNEEDSTTQVMTLMFSKYEIIFLHTFVLWNISKLTDKIQTIALNTSRLEDILKDILKQLSNIIVYTTSAFESANKNSELCIKSNNNRKKIFTTELYINNSQQVQMLGKWAISRQIFKNIDLDNTKLVNKHCSYWIICIVNGFLIESINYLKSVNILFDISLIQGEIESFWVLIKQYLSHQEEFTVTHALYNEFINMIKGVSSNL
ncbi:uncharacterized protein CMU_022190 [Cryptosporidium muris RN66]|uniref:Vacuolar protein sorting-associated protein 51 homolog n=1 Tax=Cryptosporidium muris (strain RN66) TaxID=441375 RepID=B6AK46_CRYMR|nr:uncharacterized protein CMU_022190 [Cryptosporidium muris RN66]EEA08587.1 hypothetical protein CMU_022190 [Cryptosporidium muris RN66]|eukprot:XP_002142936.1 hypothetical protein [Cryptosporidium muris RN66]